MTVYEEVAKMPPFRRKTLVLVGKMLLKLINNTERLDCDQSLFCSKIYGKERKHDIRGGGGGGRRGKLGAFAARARDSLLEYRDRSGFCVLLRGFSNKRGTARSLLRDQRCYYHTLEQQRQENLGKKSGLKGIRIHDLCDTGAVLYQLSYQANWGLVIL